MFFQSISVQPETHASSRHRRPNAMYPTYLIECK